jgi:hypothetical protein
VSQQQEYWFNLKTKQVEVGKQSAAIYRVGPFATRQEAEQAEKLLAERAAAWRKEDSAEDD